jgi:RNA polymerase sigma-70 factor (ECF subfamily)
MVAQAGGDGALAAAFGTALATLPEDQREVLFLRHIVGLSAEDIAVRVRKPESAVQGLQADGRCAIRAELRRLDSVSSKT